jgi:hypothetical protein
MKQLQACNSNENSETITVVKIDGMTHESGAGIVQSL